MANKMRPKVYLPVVDTQLAVYLHQTNRTQEEVARSLGMTQATFAAKRKGDGEWTITEIMRICNLLEMSLDEAAEGVKITYPNEHRNKAAVV